MDCVPGKFNPTPGGMCTECATGTTTMVAGADSPADCVPIPIVCPAGKQGLSGSASVDVSLTAPEECRLIACGSTGNGCSSEPPRCATITEEHEVSCCSDTDPGGDYPGWQTTGSGFFPRALCTTGIFGFRRPNNDNANCNHAASYDAAVAWCADNGGRLCTADEINADCTRGTGCSHDGDLMWTSSPAFSSDGVTEADCMDCVAGKFNPTAGGMCTECATGKTTMVAGAISPAECVDELGPLPNPPTEPNPPTNGGSVDVTINVATVAYGNEITWNVDGGTDYGNGNYVDNEAYTETLSLAEGAHTLNCMDSYGDGWNGGSIEVVGLLDPVQPEGEGGSYDFTV
jgi:hypothetical protein